MVSQVKDDDDLEQFGRWKWWKTVGLWVAFDDETNGIH